MRVFLASPWIPAEWIRAYRLESRGIWFADTRRSQVPSLAAGVCAFAERIVRFAETHPEEAVVFATTCDQLRRGFDAAIMHGQARAFLFNIPATQTEAAKEIYRAELERLGRFLLELGGTAPTPECLRKRMLRADDNRRRLRAAAPEASARSLARSTARLFDHGDYLPPREAPRGERVPLALVGGPLGANDWDLLDSIETAGGRIVLNATDTGERSLCPQCDPRGDPFEALVTGYFENIVDVFARPNTRLYAWLKPLLQSRQVRGLVLWHYTACDLWRAEAETLREAFGLPVLPLEADEARGVSPRDGTRLRALVETLR